MTNPRVANCAFCDDVRNEIGGKLSFMGIYGSDMLISGQPPQALPKLAIVVWLVCDIDDDVKKFAIRVLAAPNRHEFAKAEYPDDALKNVQYADDATKKTFISTISLSPFPVQEDGFVEVMVDTDRGTMRAGRLMVRFVDPAAHQTAIMQSLVPPLQPTPT
jgi:hypothetical protein